MLGRWDARNKTWEWQLLRRFVAEVGPLSTRHYSKAGMRYSTSPDDPALVDEHGAVPITWLKVAILLANLGVWLEAAVRVAG